MFVLEHVWRWRKMNTDIPGATGWGWWAKMEASWKDSASFPSAAPMWKRKESRWKQISGVCPSHCFVLHLQIGAAEGGGTATPLASVGVCVRGGLGTSLGSDFRVKGDVFRICAKILVRLPLEHELYFFFVHFQFASVLTLNFPI